MKAYYWDGEKGIEVAVKLGKKRIGFWLENRQTQKLATPTIWLDNVGANTTAVLGRAVLGYAVLGTTDSDIIKLATPTIRLEVIEELQKLATPSIYLETVVEREKLATPTIYIEVVEEEPSMVKLATPTIYMEQVVTELDAPVISLNNGIVSWKAVDNAQWYDLYINGLTVAGTVGLETCSYDIGTLLSADEWEAGDYTIRVDAYNDEIVSEPSNAVVYTKEVQIQKLATPTIWLECTLSGKWQWNAVLGNGVTDEAYINFTSNGESFYGFDGMASGGNMVYHRNGSSPSTVYSYSTNKWTNEAYRIVDFGETEQSVSSTFYNQFIANANAYVQPDVVKLETPVIEIVEVVA